MQLPKSKKAGQQRLFRTQWKAIKLSAYFPFMPLRIPALTPVSTIVQVEIKVCIHQTATLAESSFSFTRPHHPPYKYKKKNKKEQEKRWNSSKRRKIKLWTLNVTRTHACSRGPCIKLCTGES